MSNWVIRSCFVFSLRLRTNGTFYGGFIFGSIVMWWYTDSLVPQNSLKISRGKQVLFERLITLFIWCMEALVFSPRIGEASVSATIIGTSYVLFLCGICAAHFPSTGIKVPLQAVNPVRVGFVHVYFSVAGSFFYGMRFTWIPESILNLVFVPFTSYVRNHSSDTEFTSYVCLESVSMNRSCILLFFSLLKKGVLSFVSVSFLGPFFAGW